MTVSFSDRVRVPDDVLISNVQEESVILNLDSERYFGLDDAMKDMLPAAVLNRRKTPLQRDPALQLIRRVSSSPHLPVSLLIRPC